MIDNLNLCNISDETLDIMFDKLSYDDMMSLACNYKNVNSNIEYFKSIGINCIDELLINVHFIFARDNEKIKKIFDCDNSNELVESINEDFTNIFDLL